MSKERQTPDVTGYYHPPTSSIVYLVVDPATQHAAIIDPVLDYDEKAGRVSTETADALLKEIKQRKLTIDWILDTHPHADHFSAASYLKDKLGAPIAIGAKIVEVQKLWRDIYNTPDLPVDGSAWNRLFAAGDTLTVGSLEGSVMFSPGHTLASITYVFGDAAFVHDTLFQPDYGTARADFPGGSASALYDSIQAILALPDDTRLFTGHDYQPGGREPKWESTVAEQRQSNPHIKGGITRAEFIAQREKRDSTLPMPKLILHALQVNLRAGRLPPPEGNGRSYLKIPIGAL
ncbi:MAG: MBL fold metallo-hydrolase [Rhizobiales bacterium]|nr:MBL fold metallo-hydrolase [Hyphomicrobiales bacterium]OJY46495.1 MAG: MBL fold metallo-hydrolase [Rhizobiales bacterium 64-17]